MGIGRRPGRLAELGAPLDLGRIYQLHAADVSRWVKRLRGPYPDTEDLLHEVFMVAQGKLHEFRGDAKITTWLYAIAVHVVQSQRRKERWLRWLRVGGLALRDVPPAPTPLELIETRRATEITYRLLDELPEAERNALIHFELAGLSGEEIASLTGEAIGTIWVRLHRARTRFRRAYVRWERRHRDREGER